MKSSRTKNGIRNSIINTSAYLLTILCSFIVRTVFIKTLNSEYLGINGIFTNILSLLSLAEMGIGTAIIYSLYKPLAENNKIKVMQLMNFFKKAYQTIAVVVAIIGILILPFLYKFINNVPDIPESLNVIYLLYLINSVASYLFIYKRSLLVTDQKEYVASIIGAFYTIIVSIMQIVILIMTQNFLLYLIIQIILGVVQNIAISIICDKKYPYIKNNHEILPKEEQKDIFKNVKALLIYRVASIVVNSTDNLLLSKFVGITAVGLYSNYYLIIHALYTLVRQSITALAASIGNLNTTKDIEKMKLVYNTTTFLSSWMFGLVAIGLFVILDNFIALWAGNTYVMDRNVVIVLIINFYLMGVSGVYNVLRTTYGLFTQGQLRPLISSVINFVTSIIFVKYFGIFGVFLGTCIAFISINIWYDPYIVYKHAFSKPILNFYMKNIFYVGIIIFSALICQKVSYFIFINSKILKILMDGIMVMIISNLIFIISFNKTEEFKYLSKIIKSTLNKKMKERKINAHYK